jgi:hypothetical protein
LNTGEIPPGVRQLPGAKIINLPLEEVESYLRQGLELSNLPSDDDLVWFLESYLDSIR